MSLDIAERCDKKVKFELIDSSLTVDLNKLVRNDFFKNLSCASFEDEILFKIDMCLNDFIPIFSYISSGKNQYIGKIDQFESFFNYCQYFGEIELPILVSKNSDIVSKWYMTTELLIDTEKERILLEIYKNRDQSVDEKDDVLKPYKEDFFNNKLNEKTGGKLFKELESVSVGTFVYRLEDLDSKGRLTYPCKKSSESNRFSTIEKAIEKLNFIFVDFPWKNEDGHFILAGGSVLKQLVTTQSFFNGNDYDLFLITRSEKEAVAMIEKMYMWIFTVAKDFFMIRTKNSVSFITNKGIFQIILRLYHSVEQVLCGFDIDPCCVAFDGTQLLTTKRGNDAIRYKGFPLIHWRQSESFVFRCNKYYKRGFSLYFPGITNEELDQTKDKLAHKNSSMLLKIIKGGVTNKKGDYDDIEQFYPSRLRYLYEEIRSKMIYSKNYPIDVMTTDIKLIFDSSLAIDPSDEKTVKKRESKLFLLKEMCHGQITGSFKPTTEDWYKDVKW